MSLRTLLLATALILPAASFAAETPAKTDAKTDEAAAKATDPDVARASAQEISVSRRRSIPFHGSTLAYTVTPGTLTIRNDEGEPIASMFYTAYTVDPGKSGRPRPL